MFQLINGTIECGIKPKSTYKHGVHDGNRKEWKPGKPGVRKPGVRLSNLVRKPGVRLSNLANLADFLITPVRGNLWRGDKLLAPGVLYHVIVRGNHGQKTGHTIAGQVLHCDIEPY